MGAYMGGQKTNQENKGKIGMQDGRTNTETKDNNQPDTGTELDNQDVEQEKEELMAVHIDPLKTLNNNINLKPIIEEINMEENMELTPTTQINNYGVEHVISVAEFFTTIGSAVQKALSNDGKITKDEWLLFAPGLLKIFPFITSIGSVPKELLDTLTEDEQAQIVEAVKKGIADVTDEKIKEMIPDALNIAVDLQQFMKKYFFPTTSEVVDNG